MKLFALTVATGSHRTQQDAKKPAQVQLCVAADEHLMAPQRTFVPRFYCQLRFSIFFKANPSFSYRPEMRSGDVGQEKGRQQPAIR